jgi:hypothetical protein
VKEKSGTVCSVFPAKEGCTKLDRKSEGVKIGRINSPSFGIVEYQRIGKHIKRNRINFFFI